MDGSSSPCSGLAFAAHKHALTQELFKRSKGSGFVQSALVATHRSHRARATERRPRFFGFVAKTVAIDLCCFISAHIDIVVGP